jgi:hypothetical protein
VQNFPERAFQHIPNSNTSGIFILLSLHPRFPPSLHQKDRHVPNLGSKKVALVWGDSLAHNSRLRPPSSFQKSRLRYALQVWKFWEQAACQATGSNVFHYHHIHGPFHRNKREHGQRVSPNGPLRTKLSKELQTFPNWPAMPSVLSPEAQFKLPIIQVHKCQKIKERMVSRKSFAA